MKIKDTGRPAGSPTRGNMYPRDEWHKIRCTEGYKKVLAAIKLQDPAGKLSDSDILHEALQMYAIKKLSKKTDIYYVNRMI